MMPDTFNPNPSQTQTQTQTQAQSQDQTPVDGEAFDDSIGVQGAAVTDQVSPDTGIAGAADSSPGTSEEIQRDAASVISGEAGHVTDTPEEARQTDEQRAEAEDDPLSRDTGGVFEGKRVFKANELNQSGEDKEYFHPY
ncbi:MAG: hypothetical protein ACXU8U_04615, partial [Asticcacaulis sp.]